MSLTAVILCGGKGSRLAHLSEGKPKALTPVAGKTFMEWQFDWLIACGVTHMHLAAGYLGYQIQEWCESKRRTEADSRFTISVSIEDMPLDTGGGLKYVEPYISGDHFLVLNGDTLLPNLDLPEFRKSHGCRTDAVATVAVVPVDDSHQSGSVLVDQTDRIISFHEKSGGGKGYVNGGAYILSQNIFEMIPSGKRISLEKEVFPLMSERQQLHAFKSQPPLLDMGTPDGLSKMAEFLRG